MLRAVTSWSGRALGGSLSTPPSTEPRGAFGNALAANSSTAVLLDMESAVVWQNSGRTIPGGDGAIPAVLDNAVSGGVNATSAAPVVFRKPDPFTGLATVEDPATTANIAGGSALATLTMSGLTAYTLAALVRVNKWATGSGSVVVGLRNGGNIIAEWHTPSNLVCRITNGTTTAGAGSVLEQWVTLIVRNDGTNTRAYLNGTLVGTVSQAATHSATALRFPASSASAGGKCNYLRLDTADVGAAGVATLHAALAARVAAAVPEDLTPTAMSPSDLSASYWFDSTAAAVLRNGGSEASAAGDITDWQPSAGALTLSQPATFDAPTRQTYKSTTVVRFQATGDPALSVNLGATQSVGAMTVHCVARYTQFTADVPLVSLGATRAAPKILLVDQDTQQASWDTISSTVGQNIVIDSEAHLWSFVFDGSKRLIRMFIDGCECTPDQNNTAPPHGKQAAAASFTFGGIALGYQSAGVIGGLDVASISVHLDAHTPAQCRAHLAWARSYYSSLFAGWDTDSLAVFPGASNLLIGSGATDHSVPRLMLTATAKYTRAYTQATGGMTTENGIRRLAEQLRWLMNGRTGTTVAMIYFGGNDLVTLSVANTQAAVTRMRDELLFHGIDFVVVPHYLPRTGVSEANRDTINLWLDTLPSITVVPLDDNPNIGDEGDNLDTTYFLDGIHLTDAGTEIFAGVAGPVVDGLLP